ncbi:MAG: hypothetical protein R3B84_17435 [Zavarzinella sp.]
MANWAYLCATDRETIYPSFGDQPYDASKQTIASQTYSIPLLWLALFRESDLIQRTFTQEGKTLLAIAPRCDLRRAVGQLDAAIPYLEELFYGYGKLDEYAQLFRSALENLPYQYVTIELEEIACMAKSRVEFEEILRKSLAHMGNEDEFDPKAQWRLIYLAQLWDAHPRFPPARMFLDGSKPSGRDCVIHGRILGSGRNSTSQGRTVPWES